jgi:hypothetical protein
MTQQMRLEDDWFSCAGLKGHAMEKEPHTGRNGLIFQVLVGILEEIGRFAETMTSPIVGMVHHVREGIARLQSVVVAQHARHFFNYVGLNYCAQSQRGLRPGGPAHPPETNPTGHQVTPAIYALVPRLPQPPEAIPATVDQSA